MSGHLKQMRSSVFEKFSESRMKETIMYRFSHLGMSDLYDHVMSLTEKISYKREGGDIENSKTNTDSRIMSKIKKNLTGYVTKETHDAQSKT